MLSLGTSGVMTKGLSARVQMVVGRPGHHAAVKLDLYLHLLTWYRITTHRAAPLLGPWKV